MPTPQFAARRDLPPTNELPEPPPIQDEAAALSAPLKYWAPSSASAKCPSYMFHEPGPEVRESLAILEEMRWPGGRKRLETRHAEEVVKASMRHQVEEEKRLGRRRGDKVQEAYRNKMGATRRARTRRRPPSRARPWARPTQKRRKEKRDDASVLIFEISFAVTPASCNATARLETRRPIFHLTASTVTLLSISR